MYICDFAGVKLKKEKNMKKVSAKLLLGFLGLSTLASMVGAISGTVAWYAYVTRATMSYTGTSVNSTKQLQIGLKSAVDVDFPAGTISVDLPIDGGGHYYFMNPGASLPASVINAYLEANGYTTTMLEPVSSYEYNNGEAINLRNAPIANKPFESRASAGKNQYVEIPFALRVLESDLITPTYVANKPVYLTEATAQASSSEDGDVYKAIRLFIDRQGNDLNGDPMTDFLFNPSAEDDGSTKVAGILDLSGDQLYDYVNIMSNPYYGCECLYGDYDLDGSVYGDADFVDKYMDCLSAPLATTSGLVDANDSGVTDHRTTFTAKHYEGIKYFDDLDALKTAGKYTPHYAQYLGTDNVYPTPNSDGELEGDYALCITKNNTSDNRYCIGEFNMKVFMEGWDFNIVDEEIAHMFNLGLTFEIN